MGSITRGIANNILGNGAVDGTDALSGTIPANNIANASLSNLTAFPPSVSAGIPQVASDPPSPTEGDVWYNTTTYKLKVKGVNVSGGSWASGGSLNTARGPAGVAGSGTLTSGLAISLTLPVTNVEEYDGSTWTEITDVNAGRYDGAGVGAVAPASLFITGYTPSGSVANTESYNGTSWTEVNDVNTARYNVSSFGTQTSAILGGGYVPAAVNSAIESWNGTSWTEIAELNNLKADSARTGVSNTSGLFAGGYTPASPTETVNTEIWNGTSWTEVNNLNTARAGLGGSGTVTSALAFGGFTPADVTNTEFFDGTSWTELADLATGKSRFSDSTQSSAAAFAAGSNPSTGTEEWTAPEGNLNVTLT